MIEWDQILALSSCLIRVFLASARCINQHSLLRGKQQLHLRALGKNSDATNLVGLAATVGIAGTLPCATLTLTVTGVTMEFLQCGTLFCSSESRHLSQFSKIYRDNREIQDKIDR